jgi:hypothetical protein
VPAPAPAFGGGDFSGNGNGDGNGNLQAQERVAANAVPVSRVFLNRAKHTLAKSTAAALKPLRDRLGEVLSISDDAQYLASLKKLKQDLPSLLTRINKTPANYEALRQITGAMVLNGLTSGPTMPIHRELAHSR